MGSENNIPEGWIETTLGVLMADKGYIRGPFGSALKRGEMLDHGVPVYEQANAIYNHRKFRYFISSDKYLTLSRFTVKPNDILISCSGTFGKTTIINENDPKGIISQALLILRSNPQKIDTYYLNYYLNSREGKKKLAGMSHGSVQVNIAKRADVESIEFLLPPILEQKAIAKVLTAFDDKIELLQAQNKTLETMAQTIFKEWFGKYQIGDELPEGWKVGMLEEIATPLKGRNITKKQVIEGQYPVIAGGLKPSVFHNECNTKSPVITVSASGANAGFVALHHHPVWASDSSYIDISFTNYFYFIYVFLKSSQSLIYDKQEGSAIPHVYPSHLQKLNLIIPTRLELEKFEELAANIFNKISNNKSQIDSLSKTRDTLLPKLMSGQVRVNNIKQTADA